MEKGNGRDRPAEQDESPGVRFGIRVSTWRGGAVSGYALHYYGTAWRYTEGTTPVEIDLEYELTADEAHALNEKDGASWVGSLGQKHRGDRTTRYNDLDRLLDDGTATIRKEWNHRGPIEWGEPSDVDSPLIQDAAGKPGPARTSPPIR